MLKRLLEFLRPQPAPEEKKIYLHRATRVNIYPMGDFFFTRTDVVKGSLIVANISSSGVGLIREHGDIWPPAGTELPGTFTLGFGQFPATLHIVHVSGGTVGCKFTSDQTALLEMVNKLFRPEAAGSELSEVRRDILKEDEDGVPRLFRAANGCELFFVENKNEQVLRFQLSFFGHYLEGGDRQTPRAGFLDFDPTKGDPAYKGSTLVRLSDELPRDLVNNAVRFIGAIPGLSDEVKSQICLAIGATR
jgi:hypothetical protein